MLDTTAVLQSRAPSRSRKVVLRGFAPDQERDARTWLQEHGWSITTLASAADLVVVPGGADDALLEPLRQRKLAIRQLDELQREDALLDASRIAPVRAIESRPAIEWSDTSVTVLGVELPRQAPGPCTPPEARFASTCLDAPFLQAVRAVAHAVRFGRPCALEGETASAKTTAILWLAHLTGAQVLRLNLHGQTDTGELTGRYVPDDRPGTQSRWRFQESAIPRAMRSGWWVLLDELNLAEPQILERLNPVLENPPGLVLSEGPGTVFARGSGRERPDVVDIHPGFRIFATMNPSEYAGRSVLSPAFRDRWTSWAHVRTPDEAALRATLRFWATGEHPVVTLDGVSWQGPSSNPVLPVLGMAWEHTDLLDRVAVFHCSVAHASDPSHGGSLGRLRRERPVFSRRLLWSALEESESMLRERKDVDPAQVVGKALEHLYADRMGDASEREAVLQALRASGIAG